MRIIALVAVIGSLAVAVPVVAAWVDREDPRLGTPLTFSPALARELAPPITTTSSAIEPVVEPSCRDQLAVSVVGDSMFEVGENRMALLVGNAERWKITNWDARSGHTIESHQQSLTQDGDVVVVSFMYNEIAGIGWPESKPLFESMLETYADRTLIWVSFAEGNGGGEIGQAYAWLRTQALDGRVRIAEFGPLHNRHPEWAQPGSALGGFHIAKDSDGIAFLADTIRTELDRVAAERFGPAGTVCP